MKMLLMVECPNEPFNSFVRAGTIGQVIKQILDCIKPEAVYFTEQDGRRGAILVIDVQDSSEIPAFSEPFFLHFNATCKFRIVLNAEDLQKSGLEALGQKWA